MVGPHLVFLCFRGVSTDFFIRGQLIYMCLDIIACARSIPAPDGFSEEAGLVFLLSNDITRPVMKV